MVGTLRLPTTNIAQPYVQAYAILPCNTPLTT